MYTIIFCNTYTIINLYIYECIFLGVYVPACDSEGYYEHTQCHSSVGMCWCVDKHGVEVPNSRVRGKPNCCKCTINYSLYNLTRQLNVINVLNMN